MAFDLFKTHVLLAAAQELPPAKSFLKDRYFPTNPSTDIFATEDVLIEYKAGNKKVAPFVAPMHKGITITREGSYMERYTPPLVAPRRVLTLDDLKKRGFGEALMSELTPQQRQATMIAQDIDELSKMITRREELMASEIMATNKCIMKHYADDLKTVVEEKSLQFFDGGSNPAEYTTTVKWDTADANIVDDIYAMIGMLSGRGLPATDLVFGADVAATIINNEKIQTLLDIRRYELGNIMPEELPEGVSLIGIINVYGRNINLFAYDETYENETGEDTPIMPKGKVVLTAPNAGRGLYGAITQLEQSDNEFHTYTGDRVPKYIADVVKDVRTITVSSAPLLIPNNINPWIVSDVLTE